MKNDLATAIITAVVGVIASYFLVNLLFGEIEDFTISSVDPNLTVNLTEPNADIFNFRSLNPTVEVYVGECDEYDPATGTCLDETKNEAMPTEDETDSSSTDSSDSETTPSESEDSENSEESEDSEDTETRAEEDS